MHLKGFNLKGTSPLKPFVKYVDTGFLSILPGPVSRCSTENHPDGMRSS